jgi:hypothetical protein
LPLRQFDRVDHKPRRFLGLANSQPLEETLLRDPVQGECAELRVVENLADFGTLPHAQGGFEWEWAFIGELKTVLDMLRQFSPQHVGDESERTGA